MAPVARPSAVKPWIDRTVNRADPSDDQHVRPDAGRMPVDLALGADGGAEGRGHEDAQAQVELCGQVGIHRAAAIC